MKNLLVLISIFIGFHAFGASIEGIVWQDLDENSLKDGGEPGMPNITVYLLSHPAGDTLQTMMTDPSGLYKFDGLVANSYKIAFNVSTAPIGLRKIADKNAPGSWDNAINCDIHPSGLSDQIVVPNETIALINMDMGLQVSPTAIISGMAWEDVNEDNIRNNGEPAIANIFVNLVDEFGNIIHKDTTDAMGVYSFLPAEFGKYVVKFDPASFPTDFNPVTKDFGSDDTIDSDVDASGKTSEIDLLADATNIDIGLKNTPVIESIGGKVWFDGNNNGLFDTGEVGVINVFVSLLDESNIEIKKDTTDAAGLYQFDGITLGNYYVLFDTASLSSSYSVTTKDAGTDDAIDSDAYANGKTDLIVLTGSITNIDMGVFTPATTGSANGKIWEDTNKDNLYTFGEPLIKDNNVFLINAAGDTVMTQITDISGQYSFVNILPDTYKIAFDLQNLPTDFTIATQDIGTDDALDCDVNALGVSSFLTINAGTVASNVDLGYTTPASPVNLTNDTLFITVDKNASVMLCVDTLELQGIFDNAHVCITPQNGEATDFTTNCFTYFPNQGYVGQDVFCVVACDETVCDTTIININIIELVTVPPVAVADIDTVKQGVATQLMVLANDTLYAQLIELSIVDYPTLGSAQVDTFGFIRYIAEPNLCDETVSLVYKICTIGGCDTTTAEIYLECNNIKLLDGFSPNGDGINETLVIKGIADYPNNTLTIFNRWGNQVFQQKGYDNTWEGYWDDENTYLPSGTYFYVFDTGEDGGRMTGSFEIRR